MATENGPFEDGIFYWKTGDFNCHVRLPEGTRWLKNYQGQFLAVPSSWACFFSMSQWPFFSKERWIQSPQNGLLRKIETKARDLRIIQKVKLRRWRSHNPPTSVVSLNFGCFDTPRTTNECPLKINGWKMYFLLKQPFFRGRVSFRWCIFLHLYLKFIRYAFRQFLGMNHD